jgi:hypothetical protein
MIRSKELSNLKKKKYKIFANLDEIKLEIKNALVHYDQNMLED